MLNDNKRLVKHRLDLRLIAKIVSFLHRYRSHPEELETFLASMRDETHAPETNVVLVRNMALTWREAIDDREIVYHVDRYLTVGIGAIDVVLLPVILPLGVSATALFVALLSLVISLVLAGTSLLISFVKQELGITAYGKIHASIVFLALASGVTALTATLWHVSSVIGLTFGILTFIAFLVCSGYLALARMAVGFLAKLQAASSPTDVDANESAGGNINKAKSGQNSGDRESSP